MTLEGVLGPNSRLDDAEAIGVTAPDALCVGPLGQLLISSGSQVLALAQWGRTPGHWSSFDADVSALAASQGGKVAVGLAGGRIAMRDATGVVLPGWSPVSAPRSVADCRFASEDELLIVDHGYAANEPVLSIAPWDDQAQGEVIALRETGEVRTVTTGLHCPMGIAEGPKGGFLVTEFERARIVDASGSEMQTGFPAYLGRIRKVGDGYVLACLSRRDPLIQYLKTEKEFVARMKARIEPRHWISPRLTPELRYDFPIELGATRLFGEIKPWAPSFSYGLVIETDRNLVPIHSAHSRANGRRHAISDAIVWRGDLIVVSRASEEIINLGPHGDSE